MPSQGYWGETKSIRPCEELSALTIFLVLAHYVPTEEGWAHWGLGYCATLVSCHCSWNIGRKSYRGLARFQADYDLQVPEAAVPQVLQGLSGSEVHRISEILGGQLRPQHCARFCTHAFDLSRPPPIYQHLQISVEHLSASSLGGFRGTWFDDPPW